MTIIHWNGSDLPAELRDLPAGTYVVQSADDVLSPEEEEGLIRALESLAADRGLAHEQVRDRLLQQTRR